MRMWMVPTRILCRTHLLGEHVEHHMFVGTLRNGYSVQGYIDNNLLEPVSLYDRHEKLVAEMKRRGMNHKSPSNEEECMKLISRLPGNQLYTKVDSQASLEDLIGRCPECKKRYEMWMRGEL